MATNSMIKLESVKPVVGKPQVQPFSKPQVRPSQSRGSSVKSEPIKSEPQASSLKHTKSRVI